MGQLSVFINDMLVDGFSPRQLPPSNDWQSFWSLLIMSTLALEKNKAQTEKHWVSPLIQKAFNAITSIFPWIKKSGLLHICHRFQPQCIIVKSINIWDNYLKSNKIIWELRYEPASSRATKHRFLFKQRRPQFVSSCRWSSPETEHFKQPSAT